MKRSYLAIILLCLAGSLAAQDVYVSPETLAKRERRKNLTVKEWNTNAKGVTKILDHVTTYSPEGNKIEEIEYDTAGKQKWRKRFERGENGKVSRELLYDERNRLVNIKKFEYNEFGRKKTQYTYDAKGRLQGTKIFEYISEDAG